MRETFSGEADFEALYRAEDWCEERGLSVGRIQGQAPHGRMTGDMRRGPVHVELNARGEAKLHAKQARTA